VSELEVKKQLTRNELRAIDFIVASIACTGLAFSLFNQRAATIVCLVVVFIVTFWRLLYDDD
jgi:hypothetical protein